MKPDLFASSQAPALHLLDDSVLDSSLQVSHGETLHDSLGECRSLNLHFWCLFVAVQPIKFTVVLMVYLFPANQETGDEGADRDWAAKTRWMKPLACLSPGAGELPVDVEHVRYDYSGFLKRKPILKNGKKPRVHHGWTRYWVAIWRSSLLFFPQKAFSKSHERDGVR